MEVPIPLWFSIWKREYTFSTLVSRIQAGTHTHSELMALYVLLLISKSDPYLPDDSHILTSLVSVRTFRDLAYFFFYYELGGELEPPPFRGSSYTIAPKYKVNGDFNAELFEDWINLVISGILPIPFVEFNYPSFDVRNVDQLNLAISYHRKLLSQGFQLTDVSQKTVYQLAWLSSQFSEFSNVLAGKGLPKYLREYRDDSQTISKIIQSYWPSVLKSFELVRPFSESEVSEIEEAHKKLVQQGSMEFLEQYAQLFTNFFESSLPDTVANLQDCLKPSNQMDARLFNKFFETYPLAFSNCLLPINYPLTNIQKLEWIEQIKKNGFEQTLYSAMKSRQAEFEEKLKQENLTLYNDRVFSTTESIYEFPPDQLVYIPGESGYYVFTQAELSQRPKTNPYNRDVFPDNLFSRKYNDESFTYCEKWSNILRRPIQTTNFNF